MKAWELQDRGFDNLRLVERPTPQPGPHDLLVRVSAVSLNHRDEGIILGDYFPQQPQLSQTPLIIVSDAAGIVAEAGVEVSRFKEGDRVTTDLFSRWIDGEPGSHEEKYSLGGPLPGGLAEYMVVHEDAAVATPTSLSDAEASTLPIAALTAWFSLVDLRELHAGHTALGWAGCAGG
jgi:NADPH:quinone reductase-like Zn-dependent oxidoreductase